MADSVGVVTRADVSATRGAIQRAEQDAKILHEALDDLPEAVKVAVDDLETLERVAKERGALHPKHRKRLQQIVDEIESAASEAEEEAELEAVGVDGVTGRGDRHENIDNVRERTRQLRREAARAQRLRRALESARGLPVQRFVPSLGARFRSAFYGGATGPGDWAASRGRRLGAQVRWGAKAATLIGVAAVGRAAAQAPHVAEDYERRIARLAARRGLFEGGQAVDRNPLRARENWIKGPDGTTRLRNGLDYMRRAFLMTGSETLRLMESLGGRFLPPGSTSPRRLLGGGGMMRRLGLSPEHVGAYLRSMYRFTGPAGAPGFNANGLALAFGTAASYAGMSNRPLEFMGDVEAAARSLGARAGQADERTVLGYAAWAGANGLGGQARRPLAQALIRGAASAPSKGIFAAKIHALRAAGPMKIGGRSYRTSLDPASLRDAKTLIESGDPQTIAAYADHAIQMADRFELGPDGAAIALQRMLGGAPLHVVQRVLETREQLRNPSALAKPAPDRNWKQGPKFRGKMGRTRAHLDQVQHYGGRVILGYADDLRAAAVSAAHAFRADGPIAAVRAWLRGLPPEIKAYMVVTGAMSQRSEQQIGAGLVALSGFGAAQSNLNIPPATISDLGDWRADTAAEFPPEELAGAPAQRLRRRAAARRRGQRAGARRRQRRQRRPMLNWSERAVAAYAAKANATPDEMLAAILLHSEDPHGPFATRKAIVHTLLNRADNSGRSLWREAVGRADTTGDQGHARPYSTARLPTGKHLQRALKTVRAAMAEHRRGVDSSGGATHYIHARTQRAMARKKPKKYKTPEQIAKSRAKSGLRRVYPRGAMHDRTWFWAPGGKK